MQRYVRFALVALLVIGAAVIWLSPVREHLTRDDIRAAIETARGTWYAPVLLVVMYAIGCVFAVPASLFIITAGAIWGWALGGTFAMAGGLLGAMASFSVARLLGVKPHHRLEHALHDTSFRSLLIVRLLPVLPFAALNYGAGILRVNATNFFFSTLLGLIPSNYVFAWSADEIFNGTLNGRAMFIRLAAVALAVVAIVVIPSLLVRAMQRRDARA